MLDSAQNRLEGPEIEPQGPFDLGEVHLTKEEPDGLYSLVSKKFVIAVLLILTSSIFTGIGIMTIDQWLWFNGAIATGYGVLNVGQKKMLQ